MRTSAFHPLTTWVATGKATKSLGHGSTQMNTDENIDAFSASVRVDPRLMP
jgi:hypothetical protein